MKQSFIVMLLLAVTGFAFVSCDKDDDDEPDSKKLNLNEITLEAGQTTKLIYNGDCSWSSDQPLIASVDEEGNVTAERVGETYIKANNETCKVTVTPKYHTYIEPLTIWGCNQSLVKDFMSVLTPLGYTLTKETSTTLTYFSSINKVEMYSYIFENGKLETSGIAAPILTAGSDITDFLLERYVVLYVDREENMFYLTSIDKLMAIVVGFNGNSIVVAYINRDSNSNFLTYSDQIKSLRYNCKSKSATKYDYSKELNSLLDKFEKQIQKP
ncbi:Ig-like domain-containing protein [Coprobacter sp.]|jgi:lipoprotein|uniref:Ig-like domain-containing protein n=1 Tax=Coprobacter sp. TaxID=1941478 RepID=UPI0025CE9F35|nr:hypothetical protein [uncultured Coprobacter sp.]